jgi:hypothetical protein
MIEEHQPNRREISALVGVAPLNHDSDMIRWHGYANEELRVFAQTT